MDAKAVSNAIVLDIEAVGAEEQHATNEEVNDELAEQVEVKEEKLKQAKVIEEVFIS